MRGSGSSAPAPAPASAATHAPAARRGGPVSATLPAAAVRRAAEELLFPELLLVLR